MTQVALRDAQTGSRRWKRRAGPGSLLLAAHGRVQNTERGRQPRGSAKTGGCAHGDPAAKANASADGVGLAAGLDTASWGHGGAARPPAKLMTAAEVGP